MNEGPSAEYYTEVLPDGRTALFQGPRPKQPPGKFPRAAQARWDSEHMATLATRVDVDTARRFRLACQAQGLTPYAALREFVLETAKNAPDGGS